MGRLGLGRAGGGGRRRSVGEPVSVGVCGPGILASAAKPARHAGAAGEVGRRERGGGVDGVEVGAPAARGVAVPTRGACGGSRHGCRREYVGMFVREVGREGEFAEAVLVEGRAAKGRVLFV